MDSVSLRNKNTNQFFRNKLFLIFKFQIVTHFSKMLQALNICITAMLITIILAGCNNKKSADTSSEIDSVAGNADVARYLKSF